MLPLLSKNLVFLMSGTALIISSGRVLVFIVL